MRRPAVLLLVSCAACSSEAGPSPVPTPEGCAVADLVLDDGSCVAPGVPSDACADGFVAEADLCIPQLPAEPCPDGLMAAVGETQCRPVAPCGQGPWGDIPAGPSTIYVDASFTGPTSDGSQTLPYPDLQQAVAAAPVDSIIAIASGTYGGWVGISKRITLWGKCPTEVSLDSQDPTRPSIIVEGDAARGTVIRALALTGASAGAAVNGTDVTFEQVWVHDTGEVGVQGDGLIGPTHVTFRAGLVEHAVRAGMHFDTAEGIVEASVVREGVALTGVAGRGIGSNAPAHVEVLGTLVEANQGHGLLLRGDAIVDGSVIRWSYPDEFPVSGNGIYVQDEPMVPATVQLSRSFIDANHGVGVVVTGGSLSVDATVIRGTLPDVATQDFGRGINAQVTPPTGERSNLVVSRSVVKDNHDMGVFVLGADATITSTVVRRTLSRASDGVRGRGVAVQLDAQLDAPASLAMSNCRVSENHDSGILIANSTADITATEVNDTSSDANGTFGDGIVAVTSLPMGTMVNVSSSRVLRGARVGLVSFGAGVALTDTVLECNSIDLSAELSEGFQPDVQDQGGNTCRCETEEVCQIRSTGIQPPTPADN